MVQLHPRQLHQNKIGDILHKKGVVDLSEGVFTLTPAQYCANCRHNAVCKIKPTVIANDNLQNEFNTLNWSENRIRVTSVNYECTHKLVSTKQ